jgi:hypothetical protein
MDDIAKLITDDSFIADCCRVSEGILSEAAIRNRWQKLVSETDWATMGSNAELVEAIERERIRRIRNGQTAREKAQLHAIKAPDILERIMTDESISPRHKIEASRELRAIAATGPEDRLAADRFIFKIDLGADVKLMIDKERGLLTPEEAKIIDADTLPMITSRRRGDDGDGQPL